MKNVKKGIFVLGLSMAFTFGLSISESNSQVVGVISEIDDFGGKKAKCNHNASDSQGSLTDFCSNSTCQEKADRIGNNFSTCG